MCYFSEWETTKNAETAKENTIQPVSTDTTAATNTQTETYSQQVTMMPVQVTMYTLLFTSECIALWCIFLSWINIHSKINLPLPYNQLPVAQAVPSAVSLVPPTFPVSMGMPPPGFGPPPPFIRAGFNAAQPPPGT